jgi:RHS repeat-associated protein
MNLFYPLTQEIFDLINQWEPTLQSLPDLLITKKRLKDNLGNTRVTFSDDNVVNWVIDPATEVNQVSDYYPFGLQHLPLAKGDANQRYLYNGKELQEGTDWYDYGARMYDPAIGRWHVADKLADDLMQIDKSPYSYAWNTPVNLTDPDGNCPWCVGAAIGFFVEVGSQIAANAATGKDWNDIDWADVGISTAIGAATSGIGTLATAGKVTVKTAQTLKVVAEVTEEVAQAAVDKKYGESTKVAGVNKDAAGAVVEATAGIVTSAVTGKVSEAASEIINNGTNKTIKEADRTINRTAEGSANNTAAKNTKAEANSTKKGNEVVVGGSTKIAADGAKANTEEKTQQWVNSWTW